MRCAGCSGSIPPAEVIRRAQQFIYHLDCFMCSICGLQLNTGDQFCLMEDDTDVKVVCKADYLTINTSSQCVQLARSFCYLTNEAIMFAFFCVRNVIDRPCILNVYFQ